MYGLIASHHEKVPVMQYMNEHIFCRTNSKSKVVTDCLSFKSSINLCGDQDTSLMAYVRQLIATYNKFQIAVHVLLSLT